MKIENAAIQGVQTPYSDVTRRHLQIINSTKIAPATAHAWTADEACESLTEGIIP